MARLTPGWHFYIPDKLTGKRMLRCAMAVVSCITLTLARPTSSFLGPNVFLIGTAAIYLFPKGTVGSQVTSTGIAYIGFLLGLIWYNIFEHISLYIAFPGNRVFLYLAFISGAWLCGYVRSRWPVCYLGMNFFMLVNIFGLVVAIELDEHQARTFTDFFYVFTFGAIIAFLWSLLWWENTATKIENELMAILDDLTWANRKTPPAASLAINLGDCSSLQGKLEKLNASIKASELEIMYCRIAPGTMRSLVETLDEISTSLHALELALVSMRIYSPLFLFESCPGVCELLKVLAELRSAQANLALGDIRAAIHGYEQSTDLEHGDVRSKSHDELCRELEQFKSDRYKLELNLVPDIHMAALLSQALDTALCISGDLCVILQHSRLLRVQCKGRRSLHLPFPISFGKLETRQKNCLANRRPSVDASHSIGDETKSKTLQWRYKLACSTSHIRESRHVAYAFRFQLVMGILSIFPFISDWRIWYYDVRGHWSMVFAMVVMEITRGFLFRSALMKCAGSVLGGLLAVAVYYLGIIGETRRVVVLSTCSFPCMLIIFNIALNPRFGKAGLVAALAYNLVLGVGYSTEQIWLAFLKRTATQITGIFVACAVTVLISPYHARRELKTELSRAIDILATRFHHLARGLPKNVAKEKNMKIGLRYARELLRFTKFEPSLKGQFPRQIYDEIVDQVGILADLIHNLQRLSDDKTGQMNTLHAAALTSQLCSAVSKDLYLVSHAICTKSSNMLTLVDNLSQELASRNVIQSDQSSLTILAQFRQISTSVDILRQRLHTVISRRTVPGLCSHSTTQSKEADLLVMPIQSHSEGGSLSSSSRSSTFISPSTNLSCPLEATRRASVAATPSPSLSCDTCLDPSTALSSDKPREK